MCVVNKQFELSKFILESVYVDLQYDEISHHLLLDLCAWCGICGHVVVFGLSVSCLCTLCGCAGCCDCDAYAVVCVACVYAVRVRG